LVFNLYLISKNFKRKNSEQFPFLGDHLFRYSKFDSFSCANQSHSYKKMAILINACDKLYDLIEWCNGISITNGWGGTKVISIDTEFLPASYTMMSSEY